jgi:multiple sugar transport system substrate-binding protein
VYDLKRGLARRAPVAVLATAMLLLVACSSSGSSGSKTADLTYWTSFPQDRISWIDPHFNASHPGIHVKAQYIASADNTTAKVVSAIKTNTEPNILLGEDPADLPLLAESGKLVDLKNDLTAETNALYPGIRSSLFYKGKQLGLALGGVGDYILFYNKKDFAAAGIAKPPATWDELEADAVKLSDPSQHHYGFYVPLGSAEWISYMWEGLLWANGGQLLNADNSKVAFDSPAGVAALTTWVNLIRNDHAAPTTSYAQAGSYDGAPAFAGHAVSMIIEGQWALEPFRTAKIDFGVAPFPAGTSGKSSTGIGESVAAMFDKGADANQAATTFVKWLGQPQQGAYLTAASSGLPSAPNQLDQPAVKAEAAKEPTYSVFAKQLKTGQARPTVAAYSAISEALSTQINAALTGSVSPEDALAKAAEEGNKAIADSGS